MKGLGLPQVPRPIANLDADCEDVVRDVSRGRRFADAHALKEAG